MTLEIRFYSTLEVSPYWGDKWTSTDTFLMQDTLEEAIDCCAWMNEGYNFIGYHEEAPNQAELDRQYVIDAISQEGISGDWEFFGNAYDYLIRTDSKFHRIVGCLISIEQDQLRYELREIFESGKQQYLGSEEQFKVEED